MGAPKGGFWTTSGDNSRYQPKAQFRFRVEIDGLGLEDARNPGEADDGPALNRGGDAYLDNYSDTPKEY